jgi:hypothetical protein
VSTFRWGAITQLSPLRVQLDGDPAALPLVPDCLIDPLTLAIGDRVRCERFKRRVIVHGRAGGVRMIPITAFTPVLGSITIGNGTIVARAALSGPVLIVDLNITAGSTTAITGQITCALPFGLSMSGINGRTQLGHGTFYDISAGAAFELAVAATDLSTLTLVAVNTSATYGYKVGTSSSVPVPIDTSDLVLMHAVVAVI